MNKGRFSGKMEVHKVAWNILWALIIIVTLFPNIFVNQSGFPQLNLLAGGSDSFSLKETQALF